ncbi:excinuclease ABC subunit UvrC [Phytoactinopolyspora endophytica]|uniref:excinuclease ABC subunit UvrC n=1 Tax=Phytoactinopolyspora endophytica TaxID=1642495 RepID=UPI00101D2CA1|nr:excinuclease ABC subunit UvrC [Phytoactinopolyspora endophytica]
MADPSTYRPAPGSIPVDPGVYRFSDADGRVIYVGKAKSLRSRLSSYFQDLAALHPRTLAMVTTASKVEWTVVRTEVEALQLEYSWIKEYDPRFNVRYRDDKSYPYLAVTLNEEYPRALVMRGAKKRGIRYFGPYAHAWAIRETLDQLLRVFPVRSCSKGVFNRSRQIGRPCLLGYIGKCSAPCVERVSADEHREIVEDLVAFLDGKTTTYVKRLEREMKAAAAELDFERAARLRDDIAALERAMEANAVVLGDGTDADVVALADDPLEVAVQIFYVRGGRVRGQRGWVADKAEDASPGELVERFLLQLYGETGGETVPREILVPAMPDDDEEADALRELLAELRGGKIELRVPQRGDKRSLLETVSRNAAQTLKLHKSKRASDLTTRNRALEQIQEALELDEPPLRIECYDISNLAGTEVVGSMVVFEDGLPRKSEYRKFAVRGESGTDDVAAIREVLRRRFRRAITGADDEPEAEDVPVLEPAPEATHEPAAETQETGGDDGPGLRPSRIDPETGKVRRFAYTPGLVVVDGGQPQVNAARQAMDESGVPDIPVVGLAKRLEEVWPPDSDDPLILPRTSEGLYLLQRVRDEAHRFAITFHRQRRSKSMTDSVLDTVPGLGPARRKALLAHFGSLKKVRAASAEEIAEVKGIGPGLAATIAETLSQGKASAPAVNTATGEVLDAES